MYGREPARRISLGGLAGPVPVDIIVLLAVVFGTFSIEARFPGTLEILRLQPAAALQGFVWQLLTYPFIGIGKPTLWLVLEMVILFWFTKDVFWRLGRARFWWLFGWAVGIAAVVAVGLLLAAIVLEWAPPPVSLELMQGQRTLLLVAIAAFATLYADRTIYLAFVLPVRAGWFVWLEVLFAFLGYLRTGDLIGFLGLCVAVGVTVAVLRWGGPGKALRRGWLLLRRRQLEAQLARERKRRSFRVVDGGRGGGSAGPDGGGPDGGGPWLHRRRTGPQPTGG